MDNLYTGDSRRATRNKAKRREELIDVILIHSERMWFGLDMIIMTLLFPPTHHDIKRYDEFKMNTENAVSIVIRPRCPPFAFLGK